VKLHNTYFEVHKIQSQKQPNAMYTTQNTK